MYPREKKVFCPTGTNCSINYRKWQLPFKIACMAGVWKGREREKPKMKGSFRYERNVRGILHFVFCVSPFPFPFKRLPQSAPLMFLSRLKLPFPKLPFPSLSNVCYASYFQHYLLSSFQKPNKTWKNNIRKFNKLMEHCLGSNKNIIIVQRKSCLIARG